MARLLSTWISGFIGSAKSTGNYVINSLGKKVPEMVERFVSDFGGEGWKISEDKLGKYTLEIDNIKVRESLIAHELIIEQIRAIAGSLGISQACGRVKEVQTDNDNYYLIMEGDETHGYGGFIAKDFIRCQRWTENGLKGYWVRINSIGNNGTGLNNMLVVPKTEFNGTIIAESGYNTAEYVETNDIAMNIPTAGDEVVQYGNETDKSRQSAIYIHANGKGEPALDMLTGIHSKSFAGCLAARLGGNLPDGGGFGLYSKNGRIVSEGANNEKFYEFKPDGTFSLGKGAIKFNGNKVTIGEGVNITWGPQSQSGVQYAVSDNGNTPPISGWKNDMPKFQAGKYLWTKITYPDGTFYYTVVYWSQDSLIIDIDNDTDDIPVDSTHTCLKEVERQTTVKMYNGTEEAQLTALSAEIFTDAALTNKSTNASVKSDKSTGRVNVILKNGVKYDSNLYVNITASCSIGTRNIVFTLLLNASGKAGVSPTSYQLMAEPNVINFARLSDGSLENKQVTIKLNVKRLFKENVIILNTSQSGLKVRAYWGNLSSYTDYDIGDSIIVDKSKANSYTQLRLELLKDSTKCDSETIPIIKDGVKGPQGDPGDKGADPAVYSIMTDVGSINASHYRGRCKFSPDVIRRAEAYVTTGNTTRKFDGGVIKFDMYKIGEDVPCDSQIFTSLVSFDTAIEYSRIEFKLYVNETIVAKKTVPFTWSGRDGENGKDGKDAETRHNNLLSHTNFAPPPSAYAGTMLGFYGVRVTKRNGNVSKSDFLGGADVLTYSSESLEDMFKIDVTDLLTPNVWQVMALTVRGSGSITVYCYPYTNNSTIYVDGKEAGSPSDSSASFTLSSKWERHFIAFCPTSLSGTKYFLVRVKGRAEIALCTLGHSFEYQSGANANMYIQHGVALIRNSYPSPDTYGGINSLAAKRITGCDLDFYSQNIDGCVVSGKWYTLSFYCKGDGTLDTILYDINSYRLLSNNNTPIADGTTKETNEIGQCTWELTQQWKRHTFTFRVREDGNFSKPIMLFRLTQGYGGQVNIAQVKLEEGDKATEWCLNEMDRDTITLPDWMSGWSGFTDMNENHIASGNAFFGRRNDNGTYDGCFLSSDQLTIGGDRVLGFYALKENNVMVAIDPISQEYIFRGRVYATEGEFTGTIKANEGYFNGVVTGSVRNSTTIIDMTNYSYYTEDLNGGGKGLRFDRINSIVYLNVTDGDNKLTLEEITLKLIPYSPSAESVSNCLALLGKTYVIYHRELKKLKLNGKFLKSGEVSTMYEDSITSTGSVVKLTLQLDKDGVFYWEYVAVTSAKLTISPNVMPKKDGLLLIPGPDVISPRT